MAIHFRCELPDAADMRIDVMSRMRGVDPFDSLWSRRTTAEFDGLQIELLALPNLVRAKKTQRSKDWPMIIRLLEANYFSHRDHPSGEQLNFWFAEMRTASLLIDLAGQYPNECLAAALQRSLLSIAQAGNEAALDSALRDEEAAERAADRASWEPLKRELERMRREARSGHRKID